MEQKLQNLLEYLVEWQKTVDERLESLHKKVDDLGKVTLQLGQACGVAFNQTKVVIEHLTEAVDGTRQDLSEYGGTICASTWDTSPFR
jgi:hypothetical protein